MVNSSGNHVVVAVAVLKNETMATVAIATVTISRLRIEVVYWGLVRLGSVGLRFFNSPKKLILKKHMMNFLNILIVVTLILWKLLDLLGTKVNNMASRVEGLVCFRHHEHGRAYRSHDFSGGGRSRVLVSWRSTRDATSRRRVPRLATPCYLLSFPIEELPF